MSEAKKPEYSLSYKGERTYSILGYIDEVDEYIPELKRWVIKEEYRDKFGSLLPSIVPQRKQGDLDIMPTSTNATVGLAETLKKKYGYDYDYASKLK